MIMNCISYLYYKCYAYYCIFCLVCKMTSRIKFYLMQVNHSLLLNNTTTVFPQIKITVQIPFTVYCTVMFPFYLLCYFCSTPFMRATASFVFFLSPNAVSRKKPSPLLPNPAPGVPTTLAFSKKKKKTLYAVF